MNREEEAIRYIKDNVCYGQEECFDGICKSTEDNPCAIEIAIEALEKQIPKMPVTRTIYNKYLQQKETTRVCPVCGIDTPVPRELSSWESWCPDCGQRIDWSKPKGNDCDFIFIDEVVAYDTQKKD